jgi:orotate phosphoribosyltransferase
MPGGQVLAERLWEAGAVTVSPRPITLKSGRRSHVYVSLRHFVCQPANLALLEEVFAAWLADRRPALGTVSSLLSPVLAGALAGRCCLPLVLLRPQETEKGLPGQVFGPAGQGEVVLVDDVLTSGGTALAAASLLSGPGAAAVSLFVFVDKRPASLRASFSLAVAAPLGLTRLLRHGIDSGRLAGQAVTWAEEELAFLSM